MLDRIAPPLAVSPLLATALGGGLTVLGTFITAYFQNRTKKDELVSQRQETERVERREALERRLENYREFLGLEQGLRAMVASSTRVTLKAYEDWYASFDRS